MAVGVLERMGFATLQASSAAAALPLLESLSGQCLLFTDCNMPGEMDGLGLVAVAHERWPDLPIIVTSGQRPCLENLPQGAVFLAKPYKPSELRGLVLALYGQDPAAATLV